MEIMSEASLLSAFVIIDFTATDTEKLQRYGAAASPLVARFGGEVLVRVVIEPLYGPTVRHSKLIIRFPDRESAVNWYRSPEYQEIIPVRDQAMDSQFHLVS